MTVSTKKVIKVGKSQKKHTFSFKAEFVHFFVKRLIFWQHQREAVIAAVNLIWVLQLVFDDLQHLLISLARVIKYFNDVELLYPLDKFQTNLIFYRRNKKLKHHFYRVADTINVMFLFYVSLLKVKFVWNSSIAFAVILPQQRPVLVSAHAQNFFSWSSAKKRLQENANCSAPQGVTRVANERYLPYLQLCGKTFFLWISCIEGVKEAQS